jgi:hypothetical protein
VRSFTDIPLIQPHVNYEHVRHIVIFILDTIDYLSYLIQKRFEAEVNRFRLLKRLNTERLLEHLSGDELRLFLFMIANCKNNGEGELHGAELRRIFGRDFTMKRLNDLCAKLDKVLVARITYRFRSCTVYSGLVMTYRIVFTE